MTAKLIGGSIGLLVVVCIALLIKPVHATWKNVCLESHDVGGTYVPVYTYNDKGQITGFYMNYVPNIVCDYAEWRCIPGWDGSKTCK